MKLKPVGQPSGGSPKTPPVTPNKTFGNISGLTVVVSKKEHDKTTKQVMEYAGALTQLEQSREKAGNSRSNLEKTQVNIAAIDADIQQAQENVKKIADKQKTIVTALFKKGWNVEKIAANPQVKAMKDSATIIAMAREIEAASKENS
jgi:hypothetical protein